ncbi:uncharacterized protein HaLaN_12919 [Haematococcus lacustris]|uniref:Dynein heavy chain 3 AAA+ lid domain-containing protein n=1 Tax=Haematococcus lacustris TaxID=44745 RepID=A0A699Z1S6_HAELA|nr:uncharacterized protein HaLaN_12919 [Haematococcus lacustris]
MLCVPPPSEQATKTILGSIFNGFLSDFQPDFRSIAKPIVDASVEAYVRISEELLPTPAKSHYTFNLRDLSKVFQGTLMVLPASCPSRDVMLRLWVHEASRVFHDRLINDEDKEYFKHMMAELITKHGLGATYDDLFTHRQLVFGDFMRMGLEREERKYEEVTDSSRLISVLEDYLDDYNLAATNRLSLDSPQKEKLFGTAYWTINISS